MSPSDTPGMHDSVAQRDRGYDYQQVVGDLAEIADFSNVPSFTRVPGSADGITGEIGRASCRERV